MATETIRNGLLYDRELASMETSLECLDPSLTVESQALDTDINEIVRRFGITGQLPTNVRVPSYGDFTDLTDFRGALDALDAATDSFMQMPAEVRREFSNDPALFVDFCSETDLDGKLKNLERMRALGLAVPAPAGGAAAPVPAAAPPSTPAVTPPTA